jgi:primosomal protein N' (replication factor Y)
VAIEQSIDRVLDTRSRLDVRAIIKPGQRVRVPLGRGNPAGVRVRRQRQRHDRAPKVKPLAAIDDDRVLVRPNMIELARWISRLLRLAGWHGAGDDHPVGGQEADGSATRSR